MTPKYVCTWFIVILVKVASCQEDLRDEINIDDGSTIQITRSLRNYRHGPIEENFFATINDDIVVTAGGIVGLGKALDEPNNGIDFSDGIRQWAMLEQTSGNSCYLMAIYNFGEEALFKCKNPGIYRAYAQDEKAYDWTKFASNPDFTKIINALRQQPSDIKSAGSLKPSFLKDYFEKKLRWSNRFRTEPFLIFPGDHGRTTMKHVEDLDSRKKIARSDPISIESSDYCYYWNYRINKISSAGNINDDVLSNSDKRGSYNRYDIHVWIIDPSATTYEEISVDDPEKKTVVSEYSRIITKRFYAKGLVPCVRRSHGSIEVLNVKWFAEEDPANLVHYPYWRMSIKLHTDRVISTLTDVTFTVASRQRVALYNCFVGDTRIFLAVHDFRFLDYVKQGFKKEEVNIGISNIPQVAKEYIRNQAKAFYPHPLAWAGPLSSRAYQPSSRRTDLLAITNPCKTQEFLAIASGRVHMGTALLERRLVSMRRGRLPGLDARDALLQKNEGRPIDYYMVTDAAFTPTHLVFLMSDSSVSLHPYQLKTKGIGYLAETKKYRLEAVVKRRWCAQTGYLTHNMLVPAFSSNGNFILIQLFPVEGSVNIWARPAPESCAAENRGFVAFISDTDSPEESLRNETEIHLHERVKKSDDVGRLVGFGKEDIIVPPPTIVRNMDEELTFLANNGVIFDESDPHFSEQASNPASKRIGKNNTNYNYAVIYKLDEDGKKTKKLLERNGLKISKIPGAGNLADDFKFDNIQFTAVEKRFIIASRFKTPDINERAFISMISLMTALNYPVKIKEEKSFNDPEPTLETSETFPGCLLVRTKEYEVDNVYPLKGDDIDHPDPDTFYKEKSKYPVILYTLNTALPTYVIDLGEIYVYASIDGRFARPLSFYKRNEILSQDRKKDEKKLKRETASTPNFSAVKPLHNIVVTEQGTVSLMWRKDEDNVVKKPKEAQSIAIGSIYTVEPLREMKPFTSNSKVFQWASPDNEILYGRFVEYQRERFHDCGSPKEDKKKDLGCIRQKDPPGPDAPYCSKENIKINAYQLSPVAPYYQCKSFKFNYYKNIDWKKVKDKNLVNRVKNFASAFNSDKTMEELEYCTDPTSKTKGCFEVYDEEKAKKLCEPGESIADCTLPPVKHQSSLNLYSIELLGTPYYNLLKGSLEYAEVEETPSIIEDKKTDKKDTTCPFAGFKVIKTDFDYAEIGFSTRITAEVSYFGKNVPIEADLLVEFENVVGIKVEVASSLTEERDQTSVTKTIDIYFQMTDSDLKRMENAHKSRVRGKEESLADNARIFSITLRPTVINLYCPKDEISTTLQINVGCNPFSKMRLIAEATALNKITLKTPKERSEGDTKAWVTQGNFLSVPREDVHHRQRKLFKCKQINETYCMIPHANIYGSNVFNISWRDKFTPKFEQFLTSQSRRVTGNVAIYDLLGDIVGLSLTRLEAKCYNNANRWYKKLLAQQIHLGKNVSVHEDIYEYYKDCYDQSYPRETPKLLSNESYRLHNLTNGNSIKFTRKPNPRNKIYIFRAVVVNTYYNRFTYCPNLDTIFLVKIVGIPTPRQALPWKYSIAITVLILIVLVFTYIHFSFCYSWKGDASDTKASANIEENVEDDILNEEYLRDEEHIEFDFTQRVRTSDGFLERFAAKIYALTRWRKRAAEEVQKRAEEKKEH